MSKKVAVISGGTSGIGKRMVSMFLKSGVKVVTFSRNKSKINLLKRELREYSEDLICYQGDVSSIKDISRISKSVKKQFKKVNYLVNNSGTNVLNPIHKIKIKDWENIINVNLTGVFYLTQSMLPLLKKDSVILNMGSLASRNGFPNWSAYCASKFGLKGFTEALKEEMRPKKVRVVHAEIGATNTAIWNNLDGKWDRSVMMNDSEVAHILFDSITKVKSVNVDEIFLMPPDGVI
ncbi:SDR family oxidoreductase [bacterium]|jgi:NADP-dependent 3-hydroxy acid dehydrogenase YdfG|nr:SDR family oxidoreductase [bacterium]MBT3849934.1 SDR family oxidoreductase [bacterium]MBT4434914.1 SDR family oxidoreductase [bacterium]MDG2445384.1 SDR family oxidoreductase [Thermodesulfobacteriota bacterium]|tara:strand:+ start:14403 stop:15107 length:705 start_codon:yes stop_codon:yes gene_type:complete